MRFFGKKREEVNSISSEIKPSNLENLCGDDKRLYRDLNSSMYLKPNGHGKYSDALKKAESLEREGKKDDAARAYQHAGALALYEGNVEGVKRTFDKRAELSDRKFPRIREVPEKAVETVRKYYEKYGTSG